MNIFPAQPGTFIVERDLTVSPPVTVRVPVVGWNHVQGTMAFPIAVMNHGGLTHGKAILHPEGFVSDPTHGQVFTNLEEWETFMRTAKPGRKQAPPKPSDEQADDYLETMEPADAYEAEQAEEEEVENGEDAANEAVGPIEFGTKSYKSRSFWKYPLAGAIFQIEGGEPYPKDDRVEKITRDEFAALKKDGYAVIDPTLGEVSEEDDDDAMDLV